MSMETEEEKLASFVALVKAGYPPTFRQVCGCLWAFSKIRFKRYVMAAKGIVEEIVEAFK